MIFNQVLNYSIYFLSNLIDIYIRHYSALNSIASDHQKKLQSLPYIHCEWHLGPTGCGKSRHVREEYPDAYIKDCEPKRTHFWGGYNGEPVVICEDIDQFNVGMGRQLKTWCDHYPFPTEAKFKGILIIIFLSFFNFKGSQLIRPKTIIVTSNWEIRDIWTDARTYLPLERRFKVIRYDANGPLQRLELDNREQLDQGHLRMGARDPNPTRKELNNLEVQQAILDDPFIDQEYCLECQLAPCICDILVDDSCKRTTPDHSDCEYSEDLIDM